MYAFLNKILSMLHIAMSLSVCCFNEYIILRQVDKRGIILLNDCIFLRYNNRVTFKNSGVNLALGRTWECKVHFRILQFKRGREKLERDQRNLEIAK